MVAEALLIIFLVFASCKKDEKPQEETKSDLKEMTDVEVSANGQNFVVVKSGDDKFTFTVPLGFDLPRLSTTKVVFKLTEEAYSVPVSGSELDFTSVESINITVTAEDDSNTDYTIEKYVEHSSDAKILNFVLTVDLEKFEGVVNDADGKVTFMLPYHFKDGLATAIPVFSTSPSATVDFASGVARDFSKSVIYEVTSQDNTKKTWEVIVSLEAPSTKNDLLDFKFKIGNEIFDGVIDKTNNTVSFLMPDDLEGILKNGIIDIEVSEYATFTPSGTLTFIGESPYTFTFTVTAQDGMTTQPWSVVFSLFDLCATNPYPGCPNYEESAPVLANTIMIGTTEYAVDEQTIEKVDEGIWYMSSKLIDIDKPLVIHTLRFETSARGYSLETWIGNDSITGRNSPTAMVNRYEAAGREVRMSINGGFYGMAVGGTPISMQKMNGVLTFLPADNYPIIGFDAQNRPYMDSVRLNSSVRIEKNNNTREINSFNGGRGQDQLVLYNSYKGRRTGTNVYGREVVCLPVNGDWENLSNHINVRCKVVSVSTAGNAVIPKGGIVLSGHGTANSSFLNALQPNDYVSVTADYYLMNEPTITSTTIRNIVNGWSIILSKNEVQDYYRWNNDSSIEPQNHPRTAVGFTDDKKYVYFTVVEGREPGVSVGVTTKELAQVMQYFGATNAINLDGGGSSCMVVDKQAKNTIIGGTWQRPVADGLAIIKK